jgi:putative DNA primase/helicase
LSQSAPAITQAHAIEAPEMLRPLRGWLVWKSEPNPKRPKPRKVPYYPETGKRRRGRNGTPEDRAQLVDFDTAVATLRRGGYDGIGFAPMPEWGIDVIDFDECINSHVDPFIEQLAAETYVEVSPSDLGAHAFVLGDMPNMKDHAAPGKFGVEVFHDSGFVTFTGKVLPICRVLDTDNLVGQAGPELVALVEARRHSRETDGSPAEHSEAASFTRAMALREVDAETLASLRDALLSDSTAELAEGYGSWVNIGQALKSLEETSFGSEALDLWHLFSARSEQYDGAQAEAKWDSFRPTKITYKSIFDLAQRNGWTNPRSAQGMKAGGADEYAKLEDRSDIGNANLLIKITGGDLRYVWEWKRWLWWDGSRWIDDKSGAGALAAAKGIAQHYHKKADDLKRQAADESLVAAERKRINTAAEGVEKWAVHCRNKKSIDALLAMASRDSRVVVSAADLDRDPFLLGVANGTIDLRTGQLRAAARDEFVTQRSPIAFDRGAGAPRFRRFIQEITGKPRPVEFNHATGRPIPESVIGYVPRPALADYLQRALGYCLTGSTAEQKVFIGHGEGSNGKSVLFDVVQELAGDYCRTVEPKFLMSGDYLTNPESPSPVAATLAGARLAISCESKEGQKLDIALIKRHSGGGFLTARGMNQNTFRFAITHKLLLMTNHKPELEHLDFALRGRLHLIPFDRKWNRPGTPERDESLPDGDRDLMTELRAEAPGILTWLIEGASRYAQEGLEPPQEVVNTTRDYLAEQDPVGRWLESFERCDPRHGTSAAELFKQFITWHRDEDTGSGGAPHSEKAFGVALRERGVRNQKKETGMHYGIKPSTKPQNLTDDGS